MGGMRDAMAWLARKTFEDDAVDVVYRRGEQSINVKAVLGSQLLRTSDRQGNVRVERTDLDCLVLADALDFGQGPTDPQRDDRVDVQTGPAVRRYRVLPVNDEPAWRLIDGGTAFRIHTKYEGNA